MNKFQDMTGMKFGRLKVLERVPNLPNSRVTRWKCKCDCGNIVFANRNNLLHKKCRSCGCLAREEKVKRNKKYNTYQKVYIGYTSNTNKEFLIDYDDYEKIKNYCWYETKQGYIATREPINKKIILLHKFIFSQNGTIDHINRNRKDNRKQNLRIVTIQQNTMNKSLQKNNKSGQCGVFYSKDRNKWVSQLTYNKHKIMKRFNTKEEAIEYRKSLETKYFGEYAPKY